MDQEVWRPIPGYEGLYEVSSLGRVRSVRVVVLKNAISRWGYANVRLYKDGGKGKHCFVHALVAAAFHGERPPGHIVNHLNGRKTDCRPENLEYTTYSGNRLHAIRNGLAPIGAGHGMAKLIEDDIRVIRSADISPRGAAAALAERFDVSIVTIRKIHRGRTWAHSRHKPARRRTKPLHNGRPRLTHDDVRTIRATPNANTKNIAEALARRFGVSPSTIHNVHWHRTWRHVPDLLTAHSASELFSDRAPSVSRV